MDVRFSEDQEPPLRNSLKFARLRRLSWRFSFLPVRNLFEAQFFPVFIGVCEPQGIIPEARNRCSGTLLPEHFRWLSHQSRQPDQVVRRATEDEQPVHFFQTSQLDLAQRTGLLQPSESLFDQPSAAQ